jgi:hypothetical protein
MKECQRVLFLTLCGKDRWPACFCPRDATIVHFSYASLVCTSNDTKGINTSSVIEEPARYPSVFGHQNERSVAKPTCNRDHSGGGIFAVDVASHGAGADILDGTLEK